MFKKIRVITYGDQIIKAIHFLTIMVVIALTTECKNYVNKNSKHLDTILSAHDDVTS